MQLELGGGGQQRLGRDRVERKQKPPMSTEQGAGRRQPGPSEACDTRLPTEPPSLDSRCVLAVTRPSPIRQGTTPTR